MVNQQMLDFIKHQMSQGATKDSIKLDLITHGGWHVTDVDEAFASIEKSKSVPLAPVTSPVVVVPVAAVQNTPDVIKAAAPETVPVRYAGFWVRWAALFIDGLIFDIAYGAIYGIGILIFGFSNSHLMGVGGISTVAFYVYFIWMTYKHQATLGKMAVGIKVTSDNGERLSIWNVILRETVGKLASGIILSIGYMMAGWTKKKQALHDKFVHSVVVYKNPEHKTNGAVIAVVAILAVLFVFAIVGILSAVVLVSLNVARSKGNDFRVESAIASTTADSIGYYGLKSTFIGFKSQYQLPTCSEPLTINTSSDGQSMAIFGKSCASLSTYYCESFNIHDQGLKPITTVAVDYALGNHTTCSLVTSQVEPSQTLSQVEDLNNKGINALNMSEYTQAESYFMEALNLDNRFAATYENLGNLYTARQDYSNAIKYLTEATVIDQSSYKPYLELGNVFLTIHDPKDAKTQFQTILTIQGVDDNVTSYVQKQIQYANGQLGL